MNGLHHDNRRVPSATDDDACQHGGAPLVIQISVAQRQTRAAIALGWLWLAMVFGATSSARAAPSVRVESDSDCPSAAQVSAALDYLLGGARQTAAADTGTTDLVVQVEDGGPRYRVTFAGQTRQYEDLARDCQERARVVAVFAAVTLEPPEVAGRPRPPTAPRRAVRPVVQPPTAERPFEVRVGMDSDVGFQRSRRALAWGGDVRAALSGRHWGIELGLGAQAPARLQWGVYQAKITRFPIDLSARGLFGSTRAVMSLSAGVAFAIFHLRGEGPGLPVRDGGTRLDVGLRSSLGLELLPAARFSPFIALHGSVWPRRYAAVVDPVDQVGTVPLVWVGATLGVAIAGR
jgi:hypothetical protein